jgi:IS5 family transposase
MSKPRQVEKCQKDLFKVPLDDIIDHSHELVLLAQKICWQTFQDHFDKQFKEGPGSPPLNPRLMVGLNMLKYMNDLSDDEIVKKWLENPYYQYFCGMVYFEHKLPCHPTSLTKWRGRMGRGGAEKILKESIRIIKDNSLVPKEEFEKIFVDTTVQEKNIAFPTDLRLYLKMRRLLVKQSQKEGVSLRQTYEKEAKICAIEYSRKSHAKQYRRAKKPLKRVKTILGRVIRDITRKAENPSNRLQWLLSVATALFNQKKNSKNKIYSIHATEVKCISKGKAHKRYEFGNKVSIATTTEHHIVVGVQSFAENHYDGQTLSDSLFQVKDILGDWVPDAYVDRGYKGYDGLVFGTRVHRQGKKRQSNETKKYLKKRARIEPVISHLKSDHRMGRNRLLGVFGDMMNSLMAGCAFNLRKVAKWLKKQSLWFIFYRFVVINPSLKPIRHQLA